MIIKAVDDSLIFPAQIGGIKVIASQDAPFVYNRPRANFSGFAVVITCLLWDDERCSCYQEEKVIAWFNAEDEARKSVDLFLDGFTWTMCGTAKKVQS